MPCRACELQIAEHFHRTGLIRWFRFECPVCSIDDDDFDPTDTGHSVQEGEGQGGGENAGAANGGGEGNGEGEHKGATSDGGQGDDQGEGAVAPELSDAILVGMIE